MKFKTRFMAFEFIAKTGFGSLIWNYKRDTTSKKQGAISNMQVCQVLARSAVLI
jgi:hypothetical protein